jgi:GT2 family glycosyltransferase
MLFRKHLGNSEKNYFEHVGYQIPSGEFRLVERPLEYQLIFGLAWAQCALVRRNVLERTGLFDREMTLYEDLDLFCRLALAGSWAVRDNLLVRIERKGDPEENLSQQRLDTPMNARSNLIYSYSRLLQDCRLTSREKRLLQRFIAEQKSGNAFEYIRSGNLKDGRRELREALCHELSCKTISRCLIAYLPASLSLFLRSSWHTLTSRKKPK